MIANRTFSGNSASNGGAIGVLHSDLSIDDDVSGAITNATIANNRAPGELCFAGATVGSQNVTLENSLVTDNHAGNAYNPISCLRSFRDGGGNFQYPVQRSGGGSDAPDALCAAKASLKDPHLGPLADNGGATLTLMPAPGSPAIGAGRACPDCGSAGGAS